MKYTLGKYLQLSNRIRYSDCNLIRMESVAEHTIKLQLLATELYQILKNEGIELDHDKLILGCYYHDFDELFMCDLPKSIKYYDEAFSSQVKRVSQEILKNELNGEILDRVNNAKDNSLEGRLVEFLDVFQPSIKLNDELRIQNNDIIRNRVHENEEFIKGYFFNNKELLDPRIINILISIVKESVGYELEGI